MRMIAHSVEDFDYSQELSVRILCTGIQLCGTFLLLTLDPGEILKSHVQPKAVILVKASKKCNRISSFT